jgi:hypothetical protein
MIPRFAHKLLGDLLIKYLVYVRPTEEIFGRKLWGLDAYRVLHTTMFWCGRGKRCDDSDDLSKHLKEATGRYLGVALGVQKWRHLATAVGRLYMIMIEPSEQKMTTMMDAGAGRTTTTSELIYALEPGDLGRLNTRTMAKFKATAALWQHNAFGLSFNKRVPSMKEILQPNADIGSDGLALHQKEPATTAPGLSSQELKEAVEVAVGNALKAQVMPFLQQALQSQLGTLVEQAISTAMAQVTPKLSSAPTQVPPPPPPSSSSLFRSQPLFDVTMDPIAPLTDEEANSLWIDNDKVNYYI